MNDTTASRQWASRPDDQRFLSLEELHEATLTRAQSCEVKTIDTKSFQAFGTEEGEIILNSEVGPKLFTNWSFGQVSVIAGAPASYLRKLDSPLAAACLNYGFERANRDQSMLMTMGDELRCATAKTYGRIYDHSVVEAVQRATEGGSWRIPAASYASSNPKRATTLYASDRDVFIFLVDEERPIELDGKAMWRGFYTWNSEVGSQVWGLATFLYETVCDNRIIWGMSHKSELRIRHTSGAPERFIHEGKKALIEYSNQSTQPLVDQIRRAQNAKVGGNEDEVKDFLKKHGLTGTTATAAINSAKAEGNDFQTAWGIAEGLTAHARSVQHTDTRITLEREAGRILDITTK